VNEERLGRNRRLVGGDWNPGILNDFPIMLGMWSSQLTIRPSFFRGVVLLHHQPEGISPRKTWGFSGI